ncbi:MAG: hypothetical protein MK135_03270 [Polyangiaceae bacterium]|nr:hypothetical protein [Polyangiaceae bacterium]
MGIRSSLSCGWGLMLLVACSELRTPSVAPSESVALSERDGRASLSRKSSLVGKKEKALLWGQDDASLWYERAENLLRLGQNRRAEEYFLKAEQLGAPPELVLASLIESCTRAGRYSRALMHIRRHVHQRPEDHALQQLAGVYFSVLNAEAQ